MAGYIRQDTTNNIANGNIINANDLDNEYDAIAAAFGAITGHKHDGTDAEGAPITKVGPVQDVVVSSTAVTPKTDNTVDLGSSTNEFKDLYIDGVANIDSLVADTADINGGTVDNAAVGATTPSTGAFTTLSATGAVSLSGDTTTGPLVVNVNSTSDALRITQTGSGNALVVEDSANPDSTPFVIDAAGRVGIGTTSVDISASASLQLKGSTSELQIQATNNAIGTPVAALSIMRYSAREGGLYLKDENALEVAFVGLPYKGGSPSQDLTFRTTGGEARFSQDGNFCLGGATVAGTSFRNVKDIAGGTTAQAYMANGVIRGDVTGAVQVYRSSPAVQDTGFTLSDLTHFSAFPGTKGANATVTNQYGFTATSALTAATNNYGFYSAISAATGRWNFYAAGTAANYFAGETTINSGLTIGRTAVTSPTASDGNVFSGTYTPTLTNVTNIDTSTALQCQYMRVGNVVTVSGQIAIDATATGQFVIRMSLPISSDFSLSTQCGGTFTASAPLYNGGAIYGDTVNNVAVFGGIANGTSNYNYYFTFTYQVL